MYFHVLKKFHQMQIHVRCSYRISGTDNFTQQLECRINMISNGIIYMWPCIFIRYCINFFLNPAHHKQMICFDFFKFNFLWWHFRRIKQKRLHGKIPGHSIKWHGLFTFTNLTGFSYKKTVQYSPDAETLKPMKSTRSDDCKYKLFTVLIIY